MTKTITKEMLKLAATIKAPEGFAREEYRGGHVMIGYDEPISIDTRGGEGNLAVVLLSETRCLIFRIYLTDVWRKGKKVGLSAEVDGTTGFVNNKGHWSSFDRRGVSSSFYIGEHGSDDDRDPVKVIERELARVDEYLKADLERVDVPKLGFRVSPARKAEMISQLKAGKVVTLTPSGFGTGYRLFARTGRAPRYSVEAAPELKTFFECSSLCYETMDCD